MTQDRRVLWVIGAGSGMGRSAAVAAAGARRVVVSGRRVEPLQESATLIERAGGEALILPLDARDGDALVEAHAAVATAWGGVDDLVLSAGLNAPRRSWADQSMSEVQEIIATNLTSAIMAIDTVLPDLRAASGQVVVISSYSGWRFTPSAGVAYSASKSALRSLCQTLNAQEASHGVRACHLCPGDVDTDFLRQRPTVPGDQARSVMLRPDDVGRAVRFVLDSPPWVRIDELVMSPVSQA